MKRLLAAALLLAPLPALAAGPTTPNTITIGINDGTSGNIIHTWTVTANEMAKIIEWIQASYLCSPQPSCTAYTPAQAEQEWMKATMQGTMDNVQRYHKAKAATDAAGNVPPINPTP